MPMHTVDTRLSHMRCLQQMGWLSFDVTHMGEPDGYLLTPCCPHGYRAVYSPRPKLDSTRARNTMGRGSDPWSGPDSESWINRGGYGERSGSGYNEHVWDWHNHQGGDQAAYFVREQKLGNEGSWVLVAGARLGDDGMPFDAQAKWWVTTQSDASTLEEELVTTGEQAYNLGFESGQGGGDYIGRAVRYRNRTGNHTFGSTHSVLRRWTKDNRAAGAAGLGASRYEDHHYTGIGSSGKGTVYQAGSGIEDPGLGEASGLPTLGGSRRAQAAAGTSFGPFDTDTIWWVLYGNRQFLGITKCGDPVGQNQERDDHFHHGDGSNWRGLGLPEFDVNAVISPTSSARGGYAPNIIFYGGDIQGAHGQAICADNGDVTGVSMVDPGATVVSDSDLNTLQVPKVTISMPNHYSAFNAKATVSTDAEEIKAAYPDMFKSLEEMQAELCDGYNDPIAQTFMVNADAYPNGIFVPKLDLCFQSKPTYTGTDKFKTKTPVYVELRPTVNGFPHADKLIASVKKHPHEVNVATGFPREAGGIIASDDPMEISRIGIDATLNSGSVYPTFDDADSDGNPNTSITTFTFESPVYLMPGEYAIVIRSNDSRYRCWLSDTGGEIVGSSSSLSRYEDDGYEKITAPTLKQFGGVFFRSSNGRTWTPNQNQDLMFRLHRCDFGAGRNNPATGTFTLGGHAIRESSDFVYHRLGIDGFTSMKPTNTNIRSVVKTKKSGDSTISAHTGYTGGLLSENEEQLVRDLAEPMTYGKDKEINDSDIQVDFTLESRDRYVSPVVSTRGFVATLLQNQIDAGGLTVSSIKMKQPGANYAPNETFTITGGGSTVDCTFKITSTNASGVIDDGAIEIVTAGENFHKSDDIVITYNGSSGSGAEFEVLSEEAITGGNSKMRYVTKTVHLAPGMSARALKVYLTAKEPYGSNIYVYYKVRSQDDSENFNSKSWKLMERTSPDQDHFQSDVSNLAAIKSKWNSTEYEFDTDEVISYSNIAGTETYDNFNTFAVKIVGFASNAAQPPKIDDFRAIAVF